MTRSKNRYIFGVCGGIAEHFDADPFFVRLLMALFVVGVFGGAGIILYLALAIIMPENGEKSTF